MIEPISFIKIGDLGPEATVLWLSVILAFVHILAQAGVSAKFRGLKWAMGPRDEIKPLPSEMSRFDRALVNFKETYPLAIIVLILQMLKPGHWELGIIAAWVWLISRAAYLIIYASGSILRSLVWFISMLAIATMMVGLIQS
jgi:uncharacterized MAPEG superfamily protein